MNTEIKIISDLISQLRVLSAIYHELAINNDDAIAYYLDLENTCKATEIKLHERMDLLVKNKTQ